MLAMIVASITAGLSGALSFIFFIKKGQFEEAEDVKYQMFREEDSI